MKNLSFISMFLFLVFCFNYPVNLVSNTKKVAYVNNVEFTLAETAASLENDPIIQMLKNDPKIEVDVLLTNPDSSVDLSGYDVVVVQEGFSSSSQILKRFESLGMANIDVPFLYNKVFAMRDGRGFQDGVPGAGRDVASDLTLKVLPGKEYHEIFDGLFITDNEFRVFKQGSDSRGNTEDEFIKKGLQYAIEVDISTEGTLLAQGTKVQEEVSVCVNDIPAGTKLGSETLKARMIAFGMNFGALCANEGYNLTDQGITLWRNAIYSLAGLNIPPTIVFSATKSDILPPVSNLQAENKESYVDLTWEFDYGELLEIIDGFEIWRGSQPENMEKVGLSDGLSYSDLDVNVGDEFYYSIRPTLASNPDAPFSDTINVIVENIPPAIPENITIESFNKRVELSWLASITADLDKFRIYRGQDSNEIALLDSVGKEALGYVDVSVINFEDYYYYITAVDLSGNESSPSDTVLGQPVNILPLIESFEDYTVHNVAKYSSSILFDLNDSYDPDGELVSFTWFVNGVLNSEERNALLDLKQGTSDVKVIVADNDGAKDSAIFKVNIDAGYYAFDPIVNKNYGISSIGDNYIYIPENDGKMQILNGELEKVIDISVPGDINAVSVISTDTNMYLSSSLRTLYSFDRLGIPKWSLPIGGDIYSSPVVDMKRDRLYIGVSNNNLFGVNRTTGQVDWLYQTGDYMTKPGLIMGSDTLLIIAGNGRVLLFDLNKPIVDNQLEPVTSYNLNDEVRRALAVDKEGFIYAVGTQFDITKFHFDKETGNGEYDFRWGTMGDFNAAPAIGNDGSVYIGSNLGRFYAFTSDQKGKWDDAVGSIGRSYITLDSAITTTATINEYGVIYVGTAKGTMYAISENGEILWKYESGSAISNATAYLNGHIVFCNADGELFKIYDEEALAGSLNKSAIIAKNPQWGTYQGNSRRSGSQSESLQTSVINLDVRDALSINVYPNPFIDRLNLEFTLNEKSDVELHIFSLDGKSAQSEIIGERPRGENSISVQLNKLPKGMYFYQLRINSNQYFGKIIKK